MGFFFSCKGEKEKMLHKNNVGEHRMNHSMCIFVLARWVQRQGTKDYFYPLGTEGVGDFLSASVEPLCCARRGLCYVTWHLVRWSTLSARRAANLATSEWKDGFKSFRGRAWLCQKLGWDVLGDTPGSASAKPSIAKHLLKLICFFVVTSPLIAPGFVIRCLQLRTCLQI